jgi:hypothetical protein
VTPDLIRRQAAMAKTMAKYRAAPFAWGGAHCIPMLRSHLVAMGHKRLPKLPSYSSALGARRALREVGFDSVAGLLDSLLPRIPVARALIGDVILMGGTGEDEERGLDAVTLATGGGKVAGWHQDAQGMVVIDPLHIKGAWRA